MKKIRIGVFGLYRGTSMINYCMAATHAQVVAICDKWEEGIARKKEQLPGLHLSGHFGRGQNL